ncbi:MAG: TrkA family potassium uptake protein [Actinobacteria bacterium]|jgi:Trk K+ transport system NAD-binding subunit|nr:MAG: TrkA family potassium uptake protein [Actinomycetota bacterium]
MQVIIAGCGRVGSQLALLLSSEGHNVVVIDRDPQAFHRLEMSFNGATLTGVAFDLDVLEEAGIRDADVFAALTNYDNTNLMAAEVARGIYGVENVAARLYNPDKEKTFQALDIDYICGTTILAEQFMQRIVRDRLKVLAWTANNRVLLVEFACPQSQRQARGQAGERGDAARGPGVPCGQDGGGHAGADHAEGGQGGSGGTGGAPGQGEEDGGTGLDPGKKGKTRESAGTVSPLGILVMARMASKGG